MYLEEESDKKERFRQEEREEKEMIRQAMERIRKEEAEQFMMVIRAFLISDLLFSLVAFWQSYFANSFYIRFKSAPRVLGCAL